MIDASNPARPPKRKLTEKSFVDKNDLSSRSSDSSLSLDDDDCYDYYDDFGDSLIFEQQTGLLKYETLQLINTIEKVTSLQRKCWGVAGANIISSNLEKREKCDDGVFIPSVVKIHAIFGFVGISDYSFLLNTLKRDIMLVINSVASVVHSEVYRWGLNGSGQCNRNLGNSFLMVFKIGADEDIRKKQQQAQEAIFENSSNKNHSISRSNSSTCVSGELQLETLPGINEFADRAAIGMLKAFASIHRDKEIHEMSTTHRINDKKRKKKPNFSD